ncbi:MAG: endonuclease/exonuclease/phosphatase family protein [Gemmatimonadota bacterium]
MKYQFHLLIVAGLGLAMACHGDSVSDPTMGSQEGPGRLRADNRAGLTVMSRNMYIGANVDAVIAALVSPDPNDDFPTLLNAISTLQETDFPTRARAIANEIARNRPHAVGLQEVSDLDLDLTGFGVPFVLSLHFLPILQAELANHGLQYVVAGEVTNTEATPLPGISLIDHDVLLVDASRVTLGALKVERNFANNIGVVAPGVDLKSGWVAVDATVNGSTIIIASTHLVSGSSPGLDQLRAAQAIELAGSLGSAAPAIIMGDLNDVPGTPMYMVLQRAGFTDTWAALAPGERGLTCCHLANLANETATFDQRIDYIFARGFGAHGQVNRIGFTRPERIPGPFHSIWPSDHAGVVASLAVSLP